MKNINVTFLSFLLILSACNTAMKKTKKAPDYAVVSGTIKNLSEDDYLEILFPLERPTEFQIAEDGTFNDTIPVKSIIKCTIVTESGYAPLVLYPGAELSLKLDGKDEELFSKMVVSGPDAKATNYLLKANRMDAAINEMLSAELYKADNDSFYGSHDRHYRKIQELLKDMDVPDAFKALEQKDLNLRRVSRIQSYAEMREDSLQVLLPEKYSSEIAKVDTEDYELYKYSNTVSKLINDRSFKEINAMMENKEDVDFNLMELSVLKKVKNDSIRNTMAHGKLNGLVYTEDVSAFYELFMDISTHPKHREEATRAYNEIKPLFAGKVSPVFEEYENYDGGTTSLSDLSGKYVYIDVWATWCMPCIAEIPELKRVEELFHDKNISFVSISVDSKKDREKWKAFVKKENLGGIQLYADDSFESNFIRKYAINSIPRFILIDPEGKIIDFSAERPSSPRLAEILNELLG